MIDFKEMKDGDIFWECCEYHWKRRLLFKRVVGDFVECINADDFGIDEKGSNAEIGLSNSKYCFKTRNEAINYQEECKSKITDMSKDQLLKTLLDKCCSHGILTKEEEKLYKKIICKSK